MCVCEWHHSVSLFVFNVDKLDVTSDDDNLDDGGLDLTFLLIVNVKEAEILIVFLFEEAWYLKTGFEDALFLLYSSISDRGLTINLVITKIS